MSNALSVVELPECDVGCGRVAIRGNFCVEHAVACTHCGLFRGAHEVKDGACNDCRRAECEDDRETYVSWRCWCGLHREAA